MVGVPEATPASAPPAWIALPLALLRLPGLQMPSSMSLCLQLIDRATSSQDEADAKGDATCLEESWKELSLLKATPCLQRRPPPAALSQSVPLRAPSPSAPGELTPPV